MHNWKKKVGIIKSRIMYDFRPFNRRRLINFYSQFIRPGDLCFDVGAHTGSRSSAWLQLGARVVAVEPQPLFAGLLENRLGSYDDFTLVSSAVGYERRRSALKISSLHPMVSTLSDSWTDVIKNEMDSIHWDDEVQVDIERLDDLISRYGMPVFSKIDVEGYEEEALKGLHYPLPALSFEFFPKTPGRTIQCLKYLQRLGNYEFNWSSTEALTFNSRVWLSYEKMKGTIGSYNSRKSGDIYARLKG